MIRAVIDINVLISSILGPLGFSRQTLLAWAAGQFTSITSEGMLATLERKLALPRIVRRYNVRTPDDIQLVRQLLRTQAELIPVAVHQVAAVTGDPEDDLVLATGRLGKAEYLVTGDRGLLDLQAHASMRIVTPREFVGILSPGQ